MMSRPSRPSSNKTNNHETSKEDIQWVFKIRCRKVKVKMNIQGFVWKNWKPNNMSIYAEKCGHT